MSTRESNPLFDTSMPARKRIEQWAAAKVQVRGREDAKQVAENLRAMGADGAMSLEERLNLFLAAKLIEAA
jgi:hypothetical protein